jgi:hypothetical protein
MWPRFNSDWWLNNSLICFSRLVIVSFNFVFAFQLGLYIVDCFLLRLASKGEYSDDLKDVFNLKSSARNNSCVDSEVATSTLIPFFSW